MKAVQVGTHGTAKVSDVGEPKLRGPQDAIVKVTAAAICGADLFPLHGMTPGFDPGTVLGHEFVGVITDVGERGRPTRGRAAGGVLEHDVRRDVHALPDGPPGAVPEPGIVRVFGRLPSP